MKKSMKIVSTLMIALMIIMVATPVFATSVTVTPVAPTETSGILILPAKFNMPEGKLRRKSRIQKIYDTFNCRYSSSNGCNNNSKLTS